MQGLILAAGASRRLYPLTENKPKCLLDVGGIPILSHQLNALKKYNIKEVIIVLGYYQDMIVDYIKNNHSEMKLTYVTNEYYLETNTSYSLYLCKDLISLSNTLLMNGDVLYPPALLKLLIDSHYENVLAVDIKQCGDEEVKVTVSKNKRITSIGKEVLIKKSLGEFIGVAKLSTHFNNSFTSSLSRLIDAEGRTNYFEAAIEPLLDRHELYYEDVSLLPCIEIDFMEDLKKANELVKNKLYEI
tara:strand:+ start:1625 stop:2356 length:732 start_codon:yes stop_codon:yes gene_type:complete